MAEHTLAILVKAIGAQKAAKDLRGVDQAVSNIGAHAGRGLRTAGHNLTNIGLIAGGAAAAGLAASVREASDLNEEINKSKVVFGAASTGLLAWSKTTATGMGLAQSEALGAAAAFGNMFNTVGVAQDESAGMSETMVQLAADMASFNNEDPSEMLDRLRSGLAGEAEPLRRFGVLLSEARVKQEAVNMGLTDGKEKLTEQQKVLARYSLIMKDTNVQQGDFERTSDSLANQQRILRAQLRNTGAVIGTALLPQITKVAIKLNKLIAAKQPEIEKFAEQLPAIFDSALEFGENIPWDAILKTFEVMGMGAKAALDLFTGLPPWVQTAVLTGWGLNKLTGGALGDIVGELGKGLIKGVLGINAGVVNINAATVNGGGIPGVGGGKGGGRFGRPGVGGLLMTGLAAGLGLEAFALQQQTSERSSEQGRAAAGNLKNMLANNPTLNGMLSSLRATETGINQIQSNPLMVLVQGSALDSLKGMRADLSKAIVRAQAPANAAANQASIASREGENAGRKPIEKLEPKVAATTSAVKNAQSIASRENSQQRSEIQRVNNATVTSKVATVSAIGRGEAATRQVAPPIVGTLAMQTVAIVAAIWASGAANKPVIQSTNVTKTTTVNNRYGPSGGWNDWNRDATR